MAQISTPVAELNDLIKGIDFAMLTTVRSNGMMYSCPMATHPIDADGVLWFLSDSHTEKVDAVRFDPRVNVGYSDLAGQRYVSVSGHCELVRDHEKNAQLWNPLYKAWFPKGLEDPDLILLKIQIEEAEYWHAPEGRMIQLTGFVGAAGSRQSPGTHGELKFPAKE